MATIGERIDELTEAYIEIYERYKDDPMFKNAASIALADPILKKFTWENVYKNVKAHIEKDEQSN